MTLLNIALYVAIAALVIVLIAGLVNLARTDENQPSRSNQLMRMRVMVQAVVVALLVVIGLASGAVNIGF